MKKIKCNNIEVLRLGQKTHGGDDGDDGEGLSETQNPRTEKVSKNVTFIV